MGVDKDAHPLMKRHNIPFQPLNITHYSY